MISIESNIEEFNRTFARYAQVYDPNGWFTADLLMKKADMIGFAWQRRLRTMNPTRGSIRAERIAALKSGSGVRVRKSVMRRVSAKYRIRSLISTRERVFGNRGVKSIAQRGKNRGKRLNFQALAVRSELNIRERGIGFRAHASRIKTLSQFVRVREKAGAGLSFYHKGSYGQLLASATLRMENLKLVFGGEETEAGKALTRPESVSALADAVTEITRDMEVYIDRKANEAARGAGFK